MKTPLVVALVIVSLVGACSRFLSLQSIYTVAWSRFNFVFELLRPKMTPLIIPSEIGFIDTFTLSAPTSA